MNIIGNNAIVGVHIGFMCEDVKGTGGKQLHSKGKVTGFRLRLMQQLFTEGTKGRHLAGLFLLPVHLSCTTINDGFLMCAYAVFVDLLDQRHDKLRLFHNGVIVAVALHHFHSVHTVFAACGNTHHGTTQGTDKGRIFALRVTDQNILIRAGQRQKDDKELRKERFACARNAQQEHRLIQEVGKVTKDQIVGNGIFSKVDAAHFLYLLHLKGHEHRKAFRGKGTQGIDLSYADRQHRVECVKLLILHRGKLAQVLSCCRQQDLCVGVKLFLGIRNMNHSNDSEHHTLVTAGKVIEKFLGFSALQFHIVGNHSGEIIVGVLPALPVGNVGFNTQHTIFHFTHRFIRGYRDDVNGKHHIPVQISQLRYHVILNIGSIIFQENDTGEFIAQLDIICVFFHAVRADIVTEIVTFTHHVTGIKMERGFFSAAVEVMQDTQLFRSVQRHTLGAEGGKVGGKVCAHTGKVRPCFLQILFVDGNGDIFFLHDAVCAGGFIKEHLVILTAVFIQFIPGHGQEDGFLKVLAVHTAVVNGDLGGGSAIQTV